MTANKGIVKRVAEERIKILYRLAKETLDSDPELSARYVRLIKQIGKHYKIRLGKEIKRNICRKCGVVLVPGKNAKVRVASSRKSVIYICGSCGATNSTKY